MKSRKMLTLIAASVLLATAALAQAPAGAPAGTTGLCKDGTYYSGATKKGACRGHKGVKEWYGTAAATPVPVAATKGGAAPAAAPAASQPPSASPSAMKMAPKTMGPGATPAAGGGVGQVWVNHKSKVYHCQGDRWYGKTKDGEYMAESEATGKGYRPDHGKPCK